MNRLAHVLGSGNNKINVSISYVDRTSQEAHSSEGLLTGKQNADLPPEKREDVQSGS